MGTRGACGFYKGGVTKVTYNHYDSYPSFLGNKIIEFLKGYHAETISEIFDDITMVNEGEKPTPEQIEQCKKWTNLSVSERSENDWYCLLRDAQGDLEAYLDGLTFMTDGSGFIEDSLFCEYAYIVNLDDKTLEFYKGFQKVPNKNRYSIDKPSDSGYYGCALVKTFTLDEIDDLKTGEIIEMMDNALAEPKDITKPNFINSVDVGVFVVNKEKYREGVPASDCGKWFVLPLSQDELEEHFAEIGITDGYDKTEYLIVDVDNEFSDIWNIGEDDDIDDVNEAVDTVEYMSDRLVKTVKAVVAAGFETFEDAVWKVKQNRYDLAEDITDAEEYAKDLCDSCYTIPDFLANYINYEEMGEDWLRDNGDVELTDFGLVRRN